MINPDELEGTLKPNAKLVDLQPMSIEELTDYIRSLEAEIQRAERMIAKKASHLSGIDALFGPPKA